MQEICTDVTLDELNALCEKLSEIDEIIDGREKILE